MRGSWEGWPNWTTPPTHPYVHNAPRPDLTGTTRSDTARPLTEGPTFTTTPTPSLPATPGLPAPPKPLTCTRKCTGGGGVAVQLDGERVAVEALGRKADLHMHAGRDNVCATHAGGMTHRAWLGRRGGQTPKGTNNCQALSQCMVGPPTCLAQVGRGDGRGEHLHKHRVASESVVDGTSTQAGGGAGRGRRQRQTKKRHKPLTKKIRALGQESTSWPAAFSMGRQAKLNLARASTPMCR